VPPGGSILGPVSSSCRGYTDLFEFSGSDGARAPGIEPYTRFNLSPPCARSVPGGNEQEQIACGSPIDMSDATDRRPVFCPNGAVCRQEQGKRMPLRRRELGPRHSSSKRRRCLGVEGVPPLLGGAMEQRRGLELPEGHGPI